MNQASELAATDPRDYERDERLQQRAPVAFRDARTLRDEADSPVPGREAVDELARIAIGTMV